MNDNINKIKEICEINGTSGHEKNVREYIISEIKDYCEYHIDNLGNIIAFKKGRKTPKNKIMLDAHTDEVGFIATYITPDGMIKFSFTGGVDTRVVLGRTAEFENSVKGVVGVKPVHLLSGDEPSKIPAESELYIDIGAKDKNDAEKYIKTGMTGTFPSVFTRLGDTKIKTKALDDRAGCLVLIDLIKSDLEYDAYFSFSVQEEIGLRGATVTSFSVSPDYAIVIETTTAADITDVPEHKQVCVTGNGCAISFMDRSTVYNAENYERAIKTAEKNNIKYQLKTYISGGNNAGVIHKSKNGVKTVTLNIPCRYLHSPSCVCDINDIESTKSLAAALISEFAND